MHIKKKTKILIFGIIVVIIGVIVGVIPILLQKKEEEVENTKINTFIKETSLLENEKIDIDDTKESEEEYIMVLEIPKINLKKGIYALNSYLNSIKYNVAILQESKMPDVDNGNLILAAHNGTSKVSYFSQLYRLNQKDLAIVYYRGIKYVYVVDNIYDVKKDGDVEIKRDINKNTLTLITCKENTNDRQLIIILYLLSKEEY